MHAAGTAVQRHPSDASWLGLHPVCALEYSTGGAGGSSSGSSGSSGGTVSVYGSVYDGYDIGAWAAALLPGLALGGEEVGTEGGAGDASRQKSGVLKFTTRNMVRECASISALSICANAAALPSVPEADWLALIATLAGLVSARDGDPRDDDRAPRPHRERRRQQGRRRR